MAIKTGQLSVVQPKSSFWKKATGYGEKYVEDFTDEASAQARGDSLVLKGYEWSVTPLSGGCYRLEATNDYSQTGGQSDPNTPLSDVWELQPNQVEKDILDSDNATVNLLTDGNKKLLLSYIDSPNTPPAFTGTTDQINAATTLLKLSQAGVKSVRIFAPVLRHTRVVRRDFTVAQSLTNVGSIIYADSLKNLEGTPGTLLFNLPTSSHPTRNDGLTMKYGWMKKYPTISQVGGGKWNLQQEFEWGLWSYDLYTFI